MNTNKDPRYGLISRDGWASGPWDGEPDRADFAHTGFVCLVLRALEIGHLNGYVGLPLTHPWADKDYDAIDADVHGGLTFASGVVREKNGVNYFHLPPARADEEYGFHAAILANPLDETSVGAYADYLRERDRHAEAALLLESPSYWWIGFDTAHSGDRQPGMEARRPELMPIFPSDRYRDIQYVSDECCSLAEQAAAATTSSS